jgi:drug/metabolite transporter (DMT)-like permease
MHRLDLARPECSPVARDYHSPVVGTMLCLVSALGYSTVNLLLRKLGTRYDPVWIIWVKETITIVPLVPWLAWRVVRSVPDRTMVRAIMGLAGIGLLTNTVATPPLVWAMGVIGVAIAVPLSLGVNLIACAAFGRWYLGERVSARTVLAMTLLTLSVALLSMGAVRANESISGSALAARPIWVALALLASCTAGVIYGGLNVVIRRAATGGIALPVIAFIVPAMGAITLAPASLRSTETFQVLADAPEDWLVLLACGMLNLMAFLAIIKGLQMTSVVRANVLTASQAAIAAVGGLLFFAEAASPALVLGISLTVAGMTLIDQPAP